jgi:hypothetical protein
MLKEPNSQGTKVGQGTKAESRGGTTSQPPKAGLWWMAELVSWDSKLNCPTLLGEELTRQSCSSRAMQLLSGKNNNRFHHLAQTGSELPHVPIATCPVDRRNQILLTSQSPDKTTSEPLLVTDGP